MERGQRVLNIADSSLEIFRDCKAQIENLWRVDALKTESWIMTSLTRGEKFEFLYFKSPRLGVEKGNCMCMKRRS